MYIFYLVRHTCTLSLGLVVDFKKFAKHSLANFSPQLNPGCSSHLVLHKEL